MYKKLLQALVLSITLITWVQVTMATPPAIPDEKSPEPLETLNSREETVRKISTKNDSTAASADLPRIAATQGWSCRCKGDPRGYWSCFSLENECAGQCGDLGKQVSSNTQECNNPPHAGPKGPAGGPVGGPSA